MAESWDLQMVLLTLIDNAFKHSGPPNTISIEVKTNTYQDLDYWIIKELIFKVRDLGHGIDLHVLNRLKNVDPHKLERSTGTGLARIHRVAKLRNWHIKPKLLYPKGTQFDIKIKIKSEFNPEQTL